ncbi:MAG: polyprenyl synthetase family protein [Candidatus Syntrophonatronum acetioxidans]|uniref:Polyprenyl synthetase family protein n=1 Tax=Candidatus Syntrophonatronum acetioxidans TaxID=1795816 RepID=A0A424YC69_9FIRM|nr:MAG: polyprenyl synthetase family protein [Candidatus Syntrophonatronum acetioxidans]
METKILFAGIKRELEELEAGLEEVLDSREKLVADISSHLLSSAGKRLRPALFFLCAKIKEEELNDHVPVAVAIELIHSATLVHDDVVDNSDTRRGQPSVNYKWGNQASVLMGDYLFAKAFAILTSVGTIKTINVMSNVIEKMSEGEIQQLDEIFIPDISEETYLNRVEKKTALFISGSCQCGGVVARFSDEEIKALKDYGYNLGMAFQITDDLLDYLGEEAKTGKPVGNDLRHGTVTLPFIYMLQDSDKKDFFKERIRDRNIDEKLINDIIKEIINTGAFDKAYDLAEKYASAAARNLQIFPDTPYKRRLESIAYFIVKRYY